MSAQAWNENLRGSTKFLVSKMTPPPEPDAVDNIGHIGKPLAQVVDHATMNGISAGRFLGMRRPLH